MKKKIEEKLSCLLGKPFTKMEFFYEKHYLNFGRDDVVVYYKGETEKGTANECELLIRCAYRITQKGAILLGFDDYYKMVNDEAKDGGCRDGDGCLPDTLAVGEGEEMGEPSGRNPWNKEYPPRRGGLRRAVKKVRLLNKQLAGGVALAEEVRANDLGDLTVKFSNGMELEVFLNAAVEEYDQWALIEYADEAGPGDDRDQWFTVPCAEEGTC